MRNALPLLAVATAVVMYVWMFVKLRSTRQQLGAAVEQLATSDSRVGRGQSGLFDPLTGLPNRTGFGDLIASQLRNGCLQPHTMVVLRPIRTQLLDNLDPEDADAAISELAVRIDGCLGPDDHLARTSDLTFAVLVAGDREAASGLVRDVMLAVEAPVRTPFRRLHLSLAAGLSSTCGKSQDCPPAAVMLQQATIALNTVASVPAGQATFTDTMLREDAQRRDLAQAVVQTLRTDATGHIDVLFEPVVDLEHTGLVGVAARAHWRDTDHGVLSAGQLVALARQAGLAARVDDTVLAEAIGAFGSWRARWPGFCQQLWITVCAETLTDEGFPDRLTGLLLGAALPPEALVLDPLDAIDALDNRARGNTAREILRQLRSAGVRVATSNAMAMGDRPRMTGPDDHADFFDISPVLVERCVEDLRARHLVQATVEYAAPRAAATAARQVTAVSQHEQLRALGCTLARGPLYGPPQPRSGTQQLIEDAAAGVWQTPVGQEAKRRRSSMAWEGLRQALHDLPIAAFACSPEGVLVLAEGSLIDELGEPGDTMDRRLADLFDVSGDSAPLGPLASALRQVRAGERTVSTVQVRQRWLQVHLCPQYGPDREVTGALGLAIDVTHQILAERALRASDQRFREIFVQAPVGMIIASTEGEVIQTNPAMADMLGFTPEDLAGRRVPDLWYEPTDPAARQQFEGVRSGEIRHLVTERAYRHRDGSAVWTHLTLGTLTERDGQNTVLAIVEDIGHVRELEIKLRHAQKLESVGMLAAGIAHEINTPIQFIGDNINFLSEAFTGMNRVLSASERLAEAADHPLARSVEQATRDIDLPWLLDEVPQAVKQSLEGVARVATIVRAMRNFGHPDQGDPTPIDINAAIRDTVIIARNEHKYVADLDLDLGDIPTVMGYPSEFHQVILNLIVNAAHAIADRIATDEVGGVLPPQGAPPKAGSGPPSTARRGHIRVRSWADETTAHVSVEDDGCGIPPRVRARIFDPFFTTKEVGRGTGQGLTIVHSVVVEKHHGTIEVDSTPGHGATFTIHLPIKPPPSVAGSTAPEVRRTYPGR